MRFIMSLSFCAILIGLSFNGIDAHWPRNFMRGNFGNYNNRWNPRMGISTTPPTTTPPTTTPKPPEDREGCPKYNKVVPDANKPFNRFRHTTSLIDKLWTSPVSKTAQKLKDLAGQMDRSRNPIWKAVAGSLASWLGSTLPQIIQGVKFDLCRYARIINISAAVGANPMDCVVLGGIMDGLILAGKLNAEFASQGIRDNAGCTRMVGEEPFRPSCYKNGEVYNMDGLWAINGPNYLPSCFQQTVKRLSQSNDFTDKFIAAVATVVTTKSMVDFYKNLDQTSTLQALALQNVTNITDECCLYLGRDIAETCALSLSSMKNAKKLALIANGCKVNETITDEFEPPKKESGGQGVLLPPDAGL